MIKFICYYLLNLNNFCKRIKNKIIFRNEYFLNKNNKLILNFYFLNKICLIILK